MNNLSSFDFEKCIESYDTEMCRDMIGYVDQDISNLNNMSAFRLKAKMKMDGLSGEEVIARDLAMLERRKQLILNRLRELEGCPKKL